ncbi:MAG: hypothetical protein A2014_12800 [Spirochaetes bacterium GWF1_49_6]|nr:MAG: hypothetical protein A2014_12800 [Spirochaetes bacterium GWF1_49_6]
MKNLLLRLLLPVVFMSIIFSNGLFGLTMKQKIKLNKVDLTVTITYTDKDKEFAQYVQERIKTYIPAVEKFLQKDLLRDKIEIRIMPSDGLNAGDYIEIGPASVESPALLFHELNHYWFGYYGTDSDSRWLIEGLMSFIPMAMYENGYLDLTEKERKKINSAWGFNYWGSVAKDNTISLIDKNGKDSKPGWVLFYPNSYKVQYIIFKELGKGAYHSLLLKLYENWPMKNISHFLSILNSLKNRDWNSLLAGWLFPGNFKKISPELFLDSDIDELADIEEIYDQTDPNNPDSDNDGYADGWEYYHGYDPASFTAIPGIKFPIIDGVAGVEKYKVLLEKEDAQNDATSSTDIKKITLYRIEDKLYIQVEFYKAELKTTYLTFHLQSSTGNNYWLQTWNPPAPHWTSQFKNSDPYEKWKTMDNAPVFEARFSGIVEMMFAPSDYKLSTFNLTFYAGGINGKDSVFDSDSININDIKW